MRAPLEALQPAAQRRWARTDKVMHGLSKAHRLAPWPLAAPDGFSSLIQAFTHQQVSMAAGVAIHTRVVEACKGRVTPQAILKAGETNLRAAGLSRPKVAYAMDLADKTLRREVEFDRFEAMADEPIIEELTAVKGIGTWTAKMFLIFHLGRPDVFAPEDLGLRAAVADAYKVPVDEAAEVMASMRPKWAPYNSVAARLLWDSRRSR
jgi:DNA-3-methyladenine glycosylase II